MWGGHAALPNRQGRWTSPPRRRKTVAIPPWTAASRRLQNGALAPRAVSPSCPRRRALAGRPRPTHRFELWTDPPSVLGHGGGTPGIVLQAGPVRTRGLAEARYPKGALVVTREAEPGLAIESFDAASLLA